MKKMKLLFMLLLFLSIPLFGYNLPENIVCSGSTNASSSGYRLWGVIGIAGYKVFGSGIGVEEENDNIAVKSFYLTNYPNPMGYGSWIEYGLPKSSSVSLKIYDLAGRDIWASTNSQKPGIYKVFWNGTDNNGQKVAKGVYFVCMNAGDFKATRKLTILR